MQSGFPKGVLLEIGLFLVTDRFKIALKYMRVCKTIYNQCAPNPRFWYHLYVQRHPLEFLDKYYIPLMGQISSQLDGQLSKEQALDYLHGRLDEFYEFDPEVRNVEWRQVFLKTTCQNEMLSQKRNITFFKQIFIDSWKKKNITTLVKKLELSFQMHINNDVKYLVSSLVPK